MGCRRHRACPRGVDRRPLPLGAPVEQDAEGGPAFRAWVAYGLAAAGGLAIVVNMGSVSRPQHFASPRRARRALRKARPHAATSRGSSVMSYAVHDKRFAFEGRGGLVRFDDGVRRGVLDWEMLVGDGPSIAIQGEACRWTEPQERKMTRDEVRELVRAFATAVPARIALGFSDGHEEIEPR
jgi:2,4-dienoyl-CoA reductase-like NADH-dependent reductase (Old Yellow Enzyme family)